MIAGGVTGVANQAVQEMAKAGLISPEVSGKSWGQSCRISRSRLRCFL